MEISYCVIVITNAPLNNLMKKVLHIITRESKKKKKSRLLVACFQLVSSSGFT